MNIQVNLKLKLVKTNKKITVKYNTFEQATFDEYLMTSLALRCKSLQEAEAYINDTTGSGSLNQHFNNLFNKVKDLPDEQLQKILDNSMFPILKIDDRNCYNYYPQLMMSEYKNRVYIGDLANMSNLLEILYINEDVIDLSVAELITHDNAEPYLVSMNNGDIKVKIKNNWVEMTPKLFETVFFNELNSSELYKGTIHSDVDGEGWNILTNATVNNLFTNSNYFYGEDGDHYQIREDGVRHTVVSQINSLYIYRENTIKYSDSRQMCEKVVDFLLKNNSINTLRTISLLNIIRCIDDIRAQGVINAILARSHSKEAAIDGLMLVEKGLYRNWNNSAMESFLQYADSKQIEHVYRADQTLNYKDEQLIKISRDLLSPIHRNIVEKYFQNLNQMKDTIKRITGEVTTSGLREATKVLQSDNDTKRFSKLCNDLIGHVSKNLEDASYADTEVWLKEAQELKELMGKLDIKVKNKK